MGTLLQVKFVFALKGFLLLFSALFCPDTTCKDCLQYLQFMLPSKSFLFYLVLFHVPLPCDKSELRTCFMVHFYNS